MKNDRTFAQISRGSLRTLVAAALVSFSSMALAATDMFLVIPGVPGESLDATYAGAIDVLAWSWGISGTRTGTVVACSMQDMSLTKYVDIASPPLLLGVVKGRIFPKVTLVIRKVGAETSDYLTIDLINARVSSLSSGGSSGEDRLVENITLNFRRPNYTYFPASGAAPVPLIVPACGP